MSALARIARPKPQLRPPRGGRHRRPRLEPDPRQRERRLPGHQRPVPSGRAGGPQGQRARPRQRPRQRRRAALLLQHRPPAQRAARCTARSGTCSPTATLAKADGCRERRLSPRTGSSSTSSTASPRWPARSTAATSSSTARPIGDVTESELKDRLILGEEGFISVIVVVDSVSGKVSAGPEIHARGHAWDDSSFEEIKQPIIDARQPDHRRGQHRHLPAPADRTPHDRPLGELHAPRAADDHPGRRRGLTRGSLPQGLRNRATRPSNEKGPRPERVRRGPSSSGSSQRGVSGARP